MQALKNKVELKIESRIKEVDTIIEHNQKKVLDAFRKNRVSDYHFADSTGYGHNDSGRETLELVYAHVFSAESALVRPHIVSGTHAIASSLFGVLRPGDELFYVTGKPYDTLDDVIGVRGIGQGSLMDYGISYQYLELKNNKIDYEQLIKRISDKTKVIGIQRSRGYDNRPSFTVAEIEEIVKFCKNIRKDLIVFVDNCYGEFVEKLEPTDVGVDLMAGSLIKNPGGGLARSGGYVVGRQDLVDQVSYRVTSPGIGRDGGAMLGTSRELFQGLFLAPNIVGEAVKGAVFAAAFFEELDIKTDPSWNSQRTDIIQAIHLGDSDKLLKFCQAIQAASPIDSYVSPMASAMPGYSDPVVMAAGTFIQGASIELSADGPMREPYTAFMQGGLSYAHVKIAIMEALEKIL